ncbi:MAG: hypothetical protein AAFQ45_12935 [Pseudomonadota bacterium]
MIRSATKLTLAAAIGLALTASAAQAETTEVCLKQTFEVAQPMQAKPPSQEQLPAIEAQMEKVENLCDAKQFAEADKERDVLKDMIAKL